MTSRKILIPVAVALFSAVILTGCFHYSFSGASIPSNVHTVYIPFFPDKSNSGISNLSDELNKALVNRFVNQSRLHLSNNKSDADIQIDGVIQSYSNETFSISGNQQASSNRVQITVNATYRYSTDDKPLWTRTFSGFGDYDPNNDPIQGEKAAALDAMDMIARKMFDDSIGKW